MKPALVIFLVVVLCNIFVVNALKCYSCAGSSTSDCAKGKTSSMVIQTCPPITPSLHSYVLGSVYASPFQEVCVSLVETNTTPNMYARGCGVFPGGVDPCTFLKQHFPVSSCKFCRTNLCETPEEQEMEFVDVNTV